MLNCYDVANYFLAQQDESAGDLISNLKLQKLVYYAQGFHLAIYDRPLFPEAIGAWTHGPVVPELYEYYQKYGNGAIPCPTEIDFTRYDEETRSLLDEVYSVFGQFSAWKLRNMTQAESPWQAASSTRSLISDRSMKDYFKTQLNYEPEAVRRSSVGWVEARNQTDISDYSDSSGGTIFSSSAINGGKSLWTTSQTFVKFTLS